MEFITGNNFKKLCNFYLDEHGYGIINKHENKNLPSYFVKTDYIDNFFLNYKPKNKFILLTHNSDYHITKKHINYLNDEFLVYWFAQNVDVVHPKIKSIPIGIANEKWPHGNLDILKKVIDEKNIKNNIIYSNFNLNTNIKERSNCLREITKKGLVLTQTKDFESYLRELSKSLFVISPNGNGVDCHKTWESLYLHTIPIVTKSLNMSFYKNLPILMLNNWDELDVDLLNQDYYNYIWNKFDSKNLYPKKFLQHV